MRSRRELEPGDFLPTERVMLERYGAGRAVLCEALRLLEFQGVIDLKPGHNGGPRMIQPTSAHLLETLVLLMELNQAPFRTVVELRIALEPMTSALAAERMSEGALARLHENGEEMRDNLDDEHTFLETNKEFHDLIAHSSDNMGFAYIVDSLLDIIDGAAIGISCPRPRREGMLAAHESILAAIRDRDPRPRPGGRPGAHARAHRGIRRTCPTQIPRPDGRGHPLGAMGLTACEHGMGRRGAKGGVYRGKTPPQWL